MAVVDEAETTEATAEVATEAVAEPAIEAEPSVLLSESASDTDATDESVRTGAGQVPACAAAKKPAPDDDEGKG